MLQQISKLGKTLAKNELTTITGGGRSACYDGSGRFLYNGRCKTPQVND